MSRRDKKIRKILEEWNQGHEARRRKEKASKVRRAEKQARPQRRRPVRPQDWEALSQDEETDFDQPSRGRARVASHQAYVEALQVEQRPSAAIPEAGPTGTVTWVSRSRLRITHARGESDCPVPRTEPRPVVGDEVRMDRNLEGFSLCRRRSVLCRSDPGHPNRPLVLAANVDQVLIVSAARRPDLRLGFVERVWLAAQRTQVPALLCVSKMDLVPSDLDLEPDLRTLGDNGLPILTTSIPQARGLEELERALRDRRTVLVGPSGAGKSSLLQAISGQEVPIGRVRHGDGKGRHTTTASQLHDLGNGIQIIDTPGVRQFGLGQVSAAELRDLFPEFATHAARCHFSDCTHTHEPRCQVREALSQGWVAPGRYRSYLRIRENA